MTLAAHQNPLIVDHATFVLDEMKSLCASLTYAALVTDDGFIVADRGRDTDGSRFASMSSSVQALSDAVARELRIGASEYVIIASADGHVIQQRVPDRPLVLAALFDTDETLGKALSISRLTARRVADYFTPQVS
ncbi:MAG: roadblock/LC7 domain-containing protein [Microbacteriaceae bacterium]